MTLLERMARLSDRAFDRLRDKAAFTLTEATAVDGDFEALRGRAYAVLVTFRRSGEAMPSPVWIALDDAGTAYVQTVHDAGKVKRLRNDDRVLLAPSNARGKPTGPAVRGMARVLPEADWAHAEATLAAAYGAGRRVYRRLLAGPEGTDAYLAITPGRP